MTTLTQHLEQALITAQAASGQTGGQPAFAQFIPIVLMVVIFYFLLIRPQQKRQKEHEKMVQAVKSGDKVVAAGGIYGVISNVKDKSVIMKIAENVKIEVDKASITLVSRETETEKNS